MADVSNDEDMHESSVSIGVDLGELVRGHHVRLLNLLMDRSHPVERWQETAEAAWAEVRRDRGRLLTDQNSRGPSFSFSSRVLVGPHSESDREIVSYRALEPVLELEFIPGLRPEEREGEPFFWLFGMHTSDDLGTEYRDNKSGTRGPEDGGISTRGSRDIGGLIPANASLVVFEFEPPSGWTPPEPWHGRLRSPYPGGRDDEPRPEHRSSDAQAGA